MRLTLLNVENFRMLRELELEGLQGYNVLVGQNATGKSTALEAARLLLEEAQMGLSREDGFRGARGEYVRLRGNLVFSDEDLNEMLPDPVPLNLQGWGGVEREGTVKVLMEVMGTVETLYNGLPPAGGGGTSIHNKNWRTEEGTDLRGQLRRSLQGRQLESRFVARLTDYLLPILPKFCRARTAAFPASRRVSSSFRVSEAERPSLEEMGPWLVQAKGEDRPEFDTYSRLLGEFLPHLRGVLVSPAGGDHLRLGVAEESLDGMTPADLWSSGTAHLSLLVASLSFLPRGSVVLVEEPELGLHPYAIRRLMERMRAAAEEGAMQFIVTTHSPVVTEEVDPELKDHAMWRFTRQADGSAKAVRCETIKDVAKAEDSLKVAERSTKPSRRRKREEQGE